MFKNRLVIEGNDIVAWFLRKVIIKDKKGKVSFQELYDKFNEEPLDKKMSKSTFIQKVRKSLINRNDWLKTEKGARSQIVFLGIRL